MRLVLKLCLILHIDFYTMLQCGLQLSLNLGNPTCSQGFVFYSSASFDHVNTSVRCMLGDSYGLWTAPAFIDLITRIVFAFLKLFTSVTLLHVLQDPTELWLMHLTVCVLNNLYCILSIEVSDCYCSVPPFT